MYAEKVNDCNRASNWNTLPSIIIIINLLFVYPTIFKVFFVYAEQRQQRHSIMKCATGYSLTRKLNMAIDEICEAILRCSHSIPYGTEAVLLIRSIYSIISKPIYWYSFIEMETKIKWKQSIVYICKSNQWSFRFSPFSPHIEVSFQWTMRIGGNI